MEHQVFEHELIGGAKGLVVHVPGAQVANLIIRFNSGYYFGDPTQYELPHALEHLLSGSGATHRFPEHNGLSIEIEKNGAYHNAHTGPMSNWYDYMLAEFELDRIIGLQAEVFSGQLFRQADLDTELSNIRQELGRNLADHSHTAARLFLAAAYPKHFLSNDERVKRLTALPRDKVLDYYQYSHTLANLRFYLSGDLADGGKSKLALLEKALYQLPNGKRFEVDYPIGQAFKPVVVHRDIGQIYYHFGWFVPALPLHLEPAASVLSCLLGQGDASRIYGNARHQGLAYSLHSSIGYDPGSASLGFSGFVTPDNAEQLYQLFTREVVEILAGKVTNKEIEAAKNLRIGSRIRSTQTSGQLLGWYMGDYEERETIEDWDGWNDRLRAVSREQVIEVANLVTTRANRGAAFVGPVSEAQAQHFAKLLDPIGQ